MDQKIIGEHHTLMADISTRLKAELSIEQHRLPTKIADALGRLYAADLKRAGPDIAAGAD